MDEEGERKSSSEGPGIPKWLPTFADMMTLLMCFFVLLLTFAEMDVKRYQQIAGSMSAAFGVQREVSADQIPMGTSVIAQEFSPGRPQPTPISEIYQRRDELPPLDAEGAQDGKSAPEVDITEQMKENIQALIRQTEDAAAALAAQLQDEISKGEVEIETRGRTIVLRIRERGSFGSGSADLAPQYRTLMRQTRGLLATQPGAIRIQGHTDDVPIATSRFRSNWELSSARAVSVAEQMLADNILDPRRFTVSGYADTRPLVPNDSIANRARNRRVEIVINQGVEQKVREQLDALKIEDPVYYHSLRIDEQGDIRPEEIF